jgi:hypothetical protein
VVDNCHVNPRVPEKLREALAGEVKWAVIDCSDVPLATCIARDKERINEGAYAEGGSYVGAEGISRLHSTMLAEQLNGYHLSADWLTGTSVAESTSEGDFAEVSGSPDADAEADTAVIGTSHEVQKSHKATVLPQTNEWTPTGNYKYLKSIPQEFAKYYKYQGKDGRDYHVARTDDGRWLAVDRADKTLFRCDLKKEVLDKLEQRVQSKIANNDTVGPPETDLAPATPQFKPSGHFRNLRNLPKEPDDPGYFVYLGRDGRKYYVGQAEDSQWNGYDQNNALLASRIKKRLVLKRVDLLAGRHPAQE